MDISVWRVTDGTWRAMDLDAPQCVIYCGETEAEARDSAIRPTPLPPEAAERWSRLLEA